MAHIYALIVIILCYLNKYFLFYATILRLAFACFGLTISVLQLSDAVITEYCIPSDLAGKSTASLQLKIPAAVNILSIKMSYSAM